MSKFTILLVILGIFGVECQESIKGTLGKDRSWEGVRNTVSFKINSNERITSKNAVISATKDETVKILKIERNSNIEYLPVNVHEIFPNVVDYYASLCSIKEIGYENFQNLFSLKRFFIVRNKLTFIAADTFKDLRSLERLDLPNNQIERVDENAFRGLTKLDLLSLRNNQISHLPENVFDDLTELTLISLNGNKLKALNDKHFKNNGKLQKVWLSNNQITSLSSTMFKHMTELKEVQLDDNVCISGTYDIEVGESQEMKDKINSNC